MTTYEYKQRFICLCDRDISHLSTHCLIKCGWQAFMAWYHQLYILWYHGHAMLSPHMLTNVTETEVYVIIGKKYCRISLGIVVLSDDLEGSRFTAATSWTLGCPRTSDNASYGSLSYSICARGHYHPCWLMMERPWRLLPAIPELDVRLWRTCDERTRTQRYKYHTLLFTLYIHDDLHRSLSWRQVSPGAVRAITRRIRGHAHPVPIRHRFPQLPAANHRAVASRLQP